jgi:hypothetical protein
VGQSPWGPGTLLTLAFPRWCCCVSAGNGPRLPHADFWSALPGLVGDGFYFSFVRCFGLRSGAAAPYKAVNNPSSAGGYGSL